MATTIHTPPKPKTQSIEQILNSLPYDPIIKETSRACYIIWGKSGSGRTTIAKQLAEAFNLELISPTASIVKAMQNADHQYHSQVLEILSSGGTIEEEMTLSIMEYETKCEAAIYRGYIIDGLPEDSDVNNPESFIRRLLINKHPNHTFILINLLIEDADIIKRKREQWIDPITNAIYIKAQIDYSRKWGIESMVHEAYEKGQKETDLERLLIHGEDSELGNSEKEGEEPTEDEEEEEEDDDSNAGEEGENKKKNLKVEKLDIKLSVKVNWPILETNVLSRLLKRSQDLDMMNSTNTELTKMKKFPDDIVDELHTFNVDSTQHPETIFESLTERAATLGYSIHYKAVPIKKLAPPEGGFKAFTVVDAIESLAATDLDKEEPVREIGIWGMYCPVSFAEEGVLKTGDLEKCVGYRGMLLFFISNEALNTFIVNPDKYLSGYPRLPSLKLCIVGGPSSGKTSQCKLLSKIYALQYVSIDEILADWDKYYQNPNSSINALYEKVLRQLKRGKYISTDMEIEILKLAILGSDSSEPLPPLPKPCKTGWVIDGFPRTLEQSHALVNAGLIPQFAVHLQNDINDEVVRARCFSFRANSITGFPWQASDHAIAPHDPCNTWMPAIPISMFAYFDNLYNGFKEEFPEILKVLHGSNIEIIPVQAEFQMQTVLSIIQTAVDPFLPKAITLNSKQQQDLPEIVEFGTTKEYCPYVLKVSNRLHIGNKALSVKYRGSVYYLSDEEARNAFVLEPHSYVSKDPQKAPPVPPIRVMFLGPKCAGKSTCIKELLRHWPGVPHVDFDIYLDKFAERQSQELRDEITYMIKENAGLLSPPIIYELIRTMFADEPYSNTGFVLEGFPRNKTEVEVMCKHGFFSDTIVYFRIEPEVGAKRLFAIKNRESKQKAADLNKVLEDAVNYFSFETKKASDDNLNSSNIDKAQAAVNEAEAALKAYRKLENEQPSDEEVLEELAESIEKENSKISEVVSSLESTGLMQIIEIDANKFIRPVVAEIRKNLHQFLENRKALFSNVLSIDKPKADVMLRLGVKYHSEFGKYCPVSLSKNSILSKSLKGKKAVSFGDYIYFLRTDEAREEFLRNPLKYVTQKPLVPILKTTLCVVGRPKSGKSSLCVKLCQELDLVHLTVPRIVESILEAGEETQLAVNLRKCLECGGSIPDNLVTQSILVVTSRAVCCAKGWILDGYPSTIAQAKSLESSGFLPFYFLELDISEKEMEERCLKDYEVDKLAGTPRLNLQNVVKLRDIQYSNEINAIRLFFSNKYANWAQLDGAASKWAINERVKRLAEGVLLRRQNYLDLKSKGRAAPVYDIGISLLKMASCIGKFGSYCPVRLIDNGELSKDESKSAIYVAEYQGLYYRMSGESCLQNFLKNADRYIFGKELPPDLPVRRNSSDLKSLFPKQLELLGYCPVTFYEGPPGFSSIIPGDPALLVEYDMKIYSFASGVNLEKFMKTPWKFTNLKLPKKLPPRHAPIPVTNLPLIGFLEQTLANAVTDAMTAVGKVKPKYPFKNLTVSSCEYIAIYLKAHNPASKEWVRKSYQKRLDKFLDRCQLISSISRGAKEGSVALSRARGIDAPDGIYVPEEYRLPDFDTKLAKFLDLRPEKQQNKLTIRPY